MAEVTPQDVEATARLKRYWLAGPGLAKWADTDTPWTHLHRELLKYMTDELAKQTASRWFIEHFGYAAGSDRNRVAHGKPPKGKKVGPG